MIVCNSSPLVLLPKINRLDMLKTLYKKVIIAKAVYEEVVTRGKEERYGDAFAIEKKTVDFIVVTELKKEFQKEAENLKHLGKGEAESIALCKQLNSALLIDDWKSRKIAEMHGIKCRSTLGTILEALKKRIITLSEYEELIKELAKHAWLSGEVVAEFLQAGYKLKGDENETRKS